MNINLKKFLSAGILLSSLIPVLSFADPLANCPLDPTGSRPPCEGGDTCDYTREVGADPFMENNITNIVDLSQANTDNFFIISPVESQTPTRTNGFIFIHGGGVDSTAYTGYAATLSAQGFPGGHVLYDSVAACTPAPPNIENTAAGVDKIIATYGDKIDSWIIAGHSLGSTLADYYVRSFQINPKIVGFAYLAGYTFDVGNNDAMPDSLKGLLILGGQDGVLTWQSALNSSALYPTDMQFQCIAGGNHANFGWYGQQSGDNQSTITADAQHQQVYDSLLAFMLEIDAMTPAQKRKLKKVSKRNKSTDLGPEITACQGT